jgi:hypothetical protein
VKKVVLAITIFVCGCSSIVNSAPSDHPIDLSYLEAHRSELNGKVVTVDGFISRVNRRGMLVLVAGRKWSGNQLGLDGEQFECDYVGGPANLWITGRGLLASYERHKPRGDPKREGAKGRRVLVRGVFHNRGDPDRESREAVPRSGQYLPAIVPGSEQDLQSSLLGPLKHATIVLTTSEQCENGDRP